MGQRLAAAALAAAAAVTARQLLAGNAVAEEPRGQASVLEAPSGARPALLAGQARAEASHRAAAANAAATRGRQWIFGSHHKSGTELLRYFSIIQAWKLNLTYCLDLFEAGRMPTNCDVEPAPGTSVWFKAQFEEPFLRSIADATEGGDLRAVHVVRDPLEMVVSGYVYAINQENARDSEVTGSVRASSSLEDGLRREAELQLRSFLPPMTRLRGLGDTRLLHLRLEDFTSSSESFDRTSLRMFNHTVGDLVPGEKLHELVEWAGQFDLRRHPTNHSPGHVSPEWLKAEARRGLGTLPAELMGRLLEHRRQLGYM